MASLPNVSLGGADDVTAEHAPGVHVSEDAPKVHVGPGSSPAPAGDLDAASDPGPGAGPDLLGSEQVRPDPGPAGPSKAGPDPRPSPGTEVTKITDLPGSDLAGDRMSTAERGLVLVRHWAVQAAAGARETTSEPGTVFTTQPPSFAEYRAYVASRAWAPEGYEKGWLLWLPLTYYNTIGNAGVLTGYAVAWITSRLLHFVITVAVATLATALIFIFN